MIFREEVHVLAAVWRLTHRLTAFHALHAASTLEGITGAGLLHPQTLYNQPGLL